MRNVYELLVGKPEGERPFGTPRHKRVDSVKIDLKGIFAHGSIQWDLWWTKWHWDRFFSESFGFPLSISFHRGLHISEN
jgi:hypothetical protein